MRLPRLPHTLQRLLFILAAFYLVFIGGSAYYNLVPQVRYFHHGFITLLLGGWLFQRLRTGRGLPTTPLNLPIFAAIGVWLAASLASIDPRMAFENLWFPLTHVVMFFILVDLFQRGQSKLVLETQFILLALVVFISGIELASWYFGLGVLPNTAIGWAEVGGFPLTWWRVSLAMNISTLLAGYLAPLVTITAAWALTVRRPVQRRILWGLAIILTLILVQTFSRGGLVSLTIAFSLFVVFRLVQSQGITSHLLARLIAGSMALGIVAVVIGFVVITLSQSRSSGDEGRIDMWLSAVFITRDHPVLGVGVGVYGRAFRAYRDASIARDKLASAHNAYLNTAAETGLIGLAVSLALGVILVRAWHKQWRSAESPAHKMRLEAAFAALMGIGVHSMVDVFTITPITLVIVGLVGYCITGHRTRTDPIPQGQRLPAAVALGVIVMYGVWFALQVDPAYGRYLNSLRSGLTFDERLTEANAAVTIDPALNLYKLHAAYLTGLNAESPDEINTALDQYRQALTLEPTWNVGWLNLAALELRRTPADTQAALSAITEAQRINPLTLAPLNRAYLAETENLLPRTAIISTYGIALAHEIEARRLPLDPFWVATDLRRDALDQYLQTVSLEIQYRVYRVHDPTRAAQLVSASPQDAAAWYVLGESQLQDGDRANAAAAFTNAVALAPTNGDYYVARARATHDTDPASAERDLKLAYLLGTRFESPTLKTANDDDARFISPTLNLGQEFTAVLYGGRISVFTLPTAFYPPALE